MSLSQDIESRIAILDVVNRYVQTKKAGVNFKALCPFHQEKTPSFIISPTKNIAKCFSCGKGGGPIRFLMEIEGIEFREAASILAKEASIPFNIQGDGKTFDPGKDMYALYKQSTDWYHAQIFTEEGVQALRYLHDRGISDNTIRAFKLGYSSAPCDLLFSLKQHGFTSDFLIESGLFVSENRDKFFGRIVFPIANMSGNVVAFTGRILSTGEPKYLNSPVSKIFNKSAILYGLHLAKQTIMQSGDIYIVEGQMDTIALHQAGILNAVGISGTALTHDHVRIIKRFAKIVYLALDADAAGIRATFASIENLMNSGLEVRIILIPNGKDPDGFIQSGGNFSELRNDSLSIVEYYLKMGDSQYNTGTIVGKTQLLEKCISLIAHIHSPIEQDFYIKHLSEVFDIPRNTIYTTLQKQKKQIPPPKNDDILSAFQPSVYDILAMLIFKQNLFDLFFQKFKYTIDDLSQYPGSELLVRVLKKTGLDDSDTELIQTIDLYIEETHAFSHPDILTKYFLETLNTLHIRLLQHEKDTLLANIDPASTEYLKIYTDLVQKAQTLGISPGIFASH